MENRRHFIKELSTLSLLGILPNSILANRSLQISNPMLPAKEKLWAMYLHLSHNMWEDKFPSLQFDEALWNDILTSMHMNKLNMVVLTLGDGIQYESHPEISVKNAWTKDKLKKELEKCRKLGIEVIPELNFSAGHDQWLGKYSRMISTETYYSVCKNLITEVIDLFDKPRFFHLGLDEEVSLYKEKYDYVVIRQNDLWWHDINFLFETVTKHGVQPWIWSDYVQRHPDAFFKNMSRSVIQSNYWYVPDFNEKEHKEVRAYIDLEAHGYDQVLTGGYFHFGPDKTLYDNILETVQFSKKRIADERTLGFLQTVWKPTIEKHRGPILKGVEKMGDAKKWFYKDQMHK